MTVGTFIIFIAVGSALVALWINVRFPKLMPWNLGRMLLHVVIAVLCVYAVGPAMSIVTDSGIPAPNRPRSSESASPPWSTNSSSEPG
jgi:hypothetical protein